MSSEKPTTTLRSVGFGGVRSCYHPAVRFDLDDIQGQPHAVDTLRAMVGSGRTPHGLIFHGPAGVGKFTTAVALCKLLLCHDRGVDLTGRPVACDACASCRLFRPVSVREGGKVDVQEAQRFSPVAHPDLHVIVKELARYSEDSDVRGRKLRSIPVQVVREFLLQRGSLAPAMRHGKVFIVDEAELLDAAGQNALLKTLEEPTPGTTIVLITSSEDRLLPTIRSRCQRVGFSPLPESLIAQHVEKHAPELDAAMRGWLVRFADGSLGRARLAVEFGLVQWAQAILPRLEALSQGRAAADLGAVLAELLGDFAERWVKRDENASKEAANRFAATLLAGLLTVEARRHLRAAAESAPMGDVDAAESGVRPWLELIESVQVFDARLNSNVNVSLACDGLSMSLHGALEPEGAGRGR